MNEYEMLKNAIHCMKVGADQAICEDCNLYYSCDHSTMSDINRVAIKALEKQIPKKPLFWENKYYFSPSPNDDWGYECPCCGNQDIDYPEHHCECGQKLYWGEEE